jgi:Flp pilus assembly protein TadD
MTKSHRNGARLGLAAFGAAMLLAIAPPAGAQVGSESPGDALSRNLRTLAANPKSLTALMGAGKAALELGDAPAAITFFGRAEEVAPTDGRVKMWIGASLVQLHNASGAIKFFEEAVRLGVPEADVARERGLAFDISGDPRRAQRDYRLALQRGRDPEATRRLALSLAISGERENALRLLEEQLLVRDRAAERSRAFILALTGDTTGAVRAVQASMPGPQGSSLAPFLERLASLTPAQRALAVHLGHFPQNWRSLPAAQPARTETYASLSDAVRAGTPDPRKPGLERRYQPAATSQTKKAAPAAAEPKTAAAQPKPSVAQPKPAQATPTPATQTASREASRPAAKAPAPPTQTSSVEGSRSVWAWSRRLEDARPTTTRPPQRKAETADAAKSAPAQTIAATTPAPVKDEAARPPATIIAEAASAAAAPAVDPVQTPVSTPPKPAAAEPVLAAPGFSIADKPAEEAADAAPASAPTSRLADVAATVAALPDAVVPKTEPQPPAKSAAAPAEKKQVPAKAAEAPVKKEPVAAAAKKPAPPAAAAAVKKVAAAPPEPARIWVQVAGGADKAALPREFARLKAKVPKLLAARAAWTTPLKATNRLLVGPFKTAGEAQEFVNELGKADLSAFTWTSEAGQKIEKLPAK